LRKARSEDQRRKNNAQHCHFVAPTTQARAW